MARNNEDVNRDYQKSYNQTRNIHKDAYGQQGQKKQTCFPAGTSILTPFGEKKIEDINEMDMVSSVNLATGKIVINRVLLVQQHADSRITIIHFEDDSQLRTTLTHSFRSGNSWRKASALKAGDAIVANDKRDATNTKVIAEIQTLSETATVYNLIVENNFNFFADGILSASFTYFRFLRSLYWNYKAHQYDRKLIKTMPDGSVSY